MKDKDNLQKRIQQKLKNKFVGKVILCETLIASIAIPTMIYVNRPVYAKMEKTITKEKTVERTLNQNEDLQDTSLTIKSTWQLNNNQQYERTYINYNVADLKEEEIQELINNEDVLMDFIIKNKGTSGVETKTTLTEEEQNNNQIDISAHYYYVDENHQIKEDKTVKNVAGLVIFLAAMGTSGYVLYNNDLLNKEKRVNQSKMLGNLSDEEIKNNNVNLKKCFELSRKKQRGV